MAQQIPSKTAVITGASSGIGLATAKALAAQDWHVIGIGRNPTRSAEAEAQIKAAASPAARVDFLRADMALMTETRHVADAIKALTGSIDLLFNNAGGVRDQRYVTSEGLEETFSANHLAPFLLTRELLPLLKNAAARSTPGNVRVLATASRAYLQVQAGLHWDDIQHLSGVFVAAAVYCEVKLANMLFTLELDRRLARDGIAAHTLVPGTVHTNFASHGDAQMQAYMSQAEGLTPDQVAQTVVWMATGKDTGLPGGRAFYDMQELDLLPHARDHAAAAKLWEESEKILARIGY